MRIAHLIGSLNIGGAENLLLSLFSAYKKSDKRDIEFFVVYTNRSNPNRVEEFKRVVGEDRVFYLECKKGVAATFRFIRRFNKFLKRNKIDFVHTHNNVDLYWSSIAKIFTSVKGVAITFHGMNLDLEFLSKKFSLFSPLFRLDRVFLNNALLSFVSNKTMSYYKERYGWLKEEVRVIYNGVDFNAFEEPMQGDIDLKEEEKLVVRSNLEQRLYCMIGNFNTKVRLQYLLIKSAERVVRSGVDNFKIYFVGSTNFNYYKECYELALNSGLLNRQIFFLGSQKDVASILHSVDYYLYASSADAFGISLIEALAARKVVYASNIDTFKEVLLSGNLGFLVENSIEGWAEVLLNTIDSGHKTLDESKYLVAREYYSIDKTLENYISFITSFQQAR